MVFESLYESAQKGELIIEEGVLCHWHLRKDGQLTIREIIVLPNLQKKGLGTKILMYLKKIPGAKCIIARCPADLPSNSWYLSKGFSLLEEQKSRTGRKINVWGLNLTNEAKVNLLCWR